ALRPPARHPLSLHDALPISLRENTTTCRGRPTSPSSRRRARTWPSDPVPPVTTTFLPSSNGHSHGMRRCLGHQLGHHLLPRRSRSEERRVGNEGGNQWQN